jgi:hypothetical protein
MTALLRKIRRRSFPELSLLVAALAVRAVVLVLLRFVRFAALRRTGTAFAGAWSRGATAGPGFERRVAWAVDTAAVLLPVQHTCLADALTAQWLLEAGGCRSTIRFGVAKTAARTPGAHAWVEAHGGIIVGAVGVGAFSVLE